MKRSLLEITGFSKRNFQLMIQFQREYAGLLEDLQRPVAELPEGFRTGKIWPQPVAEINPNDSAQPTQGSGENEIVQQAVAQLPWVHTVILSQKQKLKKNDCFAIMLTQASPEDQNFALPAIAEIDAELFVGL
jgi:hypothetical protein